VYAPESIQEAMDMMTKGFDVADEYRNPVMILADGMLGQMMEPVTIPPAQTPIMGEDIAKAKPWALTGHKNKRERNAINYVWLDQYAFAKYSDKLWEKYIKAEKELPNMKRTTWKSGHRVCRLRHHRPHRPGIHGPIGPQGNQSRIDQAQNCMAFPISRL
jgi:pyruvate/2-oxoacid:ferredoxin oxidoreductase alpha subunit